MLYPSLSFLQSQTCLRRVQRIYYIFSVCMLSGLSGCNPWFFSSETNTSHNHYHKAANYNLQLGLAYLKAGDIIKAKMKLFSAEHQNPKDASIKSAIAFFLEYIGEWEKAELYHLQALKLDRKSGAIHNNYGRFLCECHRHQEAEKHFLKAIQDSNYINTASAYENAGLCAMRIPDTDKAIDYLRIALKHNPRLGKSWLALAQLYQTQPVLAHEYLQRYFAATKQRIPAAFTLGIKLAYALKDEVALHHYAVILKTKYPTSSEYQELLSTHPQLMKSE